MTETEDIESAMAKGEDAWIRLQAWANATTNAWSRQVKEDYRRQKRSDGMVRLRAHKKEEMEVMRSQRQRLELQLKRQLATWNRTASVNDANELYGAIHRLALEGDALRSENVELYEKLQWYERLQSITHQELLEVTHSDELDPRKIVVYEASKRVRWTSQSQVPGWRVYFPNGASSFYFHPFTEANFNRAITTCDETFGVEPPFIKSVGKLFGLNMHCAPLTRRPDRSLVTHARFTTRFNSSLDSMIPAIHNTELTTLPIICTPPHWNANQRNDVIVDALQEFEKDAYVMVCNIPGPVHYRFLYFLRHLTRTMTNGKRSVSFVMTIANSEANQRSRIAEDQHNDVHWVQEGGTFMTLTEVDDAVDLTYDHWASCQDEQHAQNLFIQWAQYVLRRTQTIIPSRFLESQSKVVC